ncbi:HNH endonuclease [Methylobacterium tarhaniae]|uniref:HNH endonuclease n=1 Tax=Methylobacterium tarhaniae TaxID=1187852 RepID=UPI000A4DB6DA|nr:HNH endonuclease [Methylobacterium tarhaniae]
MRDNPTERLFASEVEFTYFLANLMNDNPSFSDISVDTIIGSRSSETKDRLARADIIAVRTKQNGKNETLIIECKNRPLYGQEIDRALEQIARYGVLRPSSRLVLALPGQLADEDAVRVRTAGIELWDLATIGVIFRSQLLRLSSPTSAAFIGEAETPASAFIRELQACEPGKKMWSIYQDLIGRILEHCFCPPLNPPLGESPDVSGVNQRDFVLANFAETGFWTSIRTRYAADYIVADAKNYVGHVKKKEVLQIANYLKHYGTGLFGMILCRTGGDASATQTVREQWAHYQKMILILDDTHIVAMLNASVRGDAASVLAKEIQEFRLSM